MIQMLKDMLRTYVLNFSGCWEKYLPLVQFVYNNGYHSNIRMAPYEALYGKKCRTPLSWVEIGETRLIGLELVQDTTEKIKRIQERLRTSQSRQKSYVDRWRWNLEF